MSDAALSLERFAAIAAQAGLRLAPHELWLMHEGHVGLQAMLARLDRPLDPSLEPALIVPSRT